MVRMTALTLDDFIASTLTQIVEGIDKAKTNLKESGREDWVSPPIASIGQGDQIHDTNLRVHYGGGTVDANLVRFDVAVHAGETAEAGGKAGVKAFVVSADLGGKTQAEEKSISHIQFEIPLIIARHEGNQIRTRSSSPQIRARS